MRSVGLFKEVLVTQWRPEMTAIFGSSWITAAPCRLSLREGSFEGELLREEDIREIGQRSLRRIFPEVALVRFQEAGRTVLQSSSVVFTEKLFLADDNRLRDRIEMMRFHCIRGHGVAEEVIDRRCHLKIAFVPMPFHPFDPTGVENAAMNHLGHFLRKSPHDR